MDALLEVENVTKSYGRNRVLHKLCLSVEPGEVVVIRGINGSGKTTLLSIIASLVSCDYGIVKILEQDLQAIFDLETELFPCLVEMKSRGVKVNLDHAEHVSKQLEKQENKFKEAIKKGAGFVPDLWAARSIAKVFNYLKLEYPRTEKTKAPSFKKHFIKNHEEYTISLINSAREANKSRTTFIETIYRYVHKGRIHADINQLRSEFGGTVTGRFSYTHPNLQQIPRSGQGMGDQLRAIFVPDEKNHKWGCFDYSQQEPRLVVHYAALQGLPGANIFVDAYNKDKKSKTD